MSNVTETAAPTAKQLTASKLMFNMTTLEREPVEVTFDFTPVTSEREFLSAVGNDHSQMLAAFNNYLEEKKTREVKAGISAREGFYSAAIVRVLVNTLREVGTFKKIADKKSQTSAILEAIKTKPVYKAMLADMAENSNSDESEDSATDSEV
jgi:hypothetical protein